LEGGEGVIGTEKIKAIRARDADIQKEIERFFTQFAQWKRPSVHLEKAWKPYCDVYESEDEVRIVVEIAGVRAEDIEILVDGRHLIIKGNRPRQKPAKREYIQQMEINFGQFERVLELNSKVDVEKAVARSRSGFLEITLPKISRAKAAGISIESESE
jgi:HSP20 family protein